jgi:hypothetical protein
VGLGRLIRAKTISATGTTKRGCKRVEDISDSIRDCQGRERSDLDTPTSAGVLRYHLYGLSALISHITRLAFDRTRARNRVPQLRGKLALCDWPREVVTHNWYQVDSHDVINVLVGLTL